jgi:hypothetical protein
MRLSFIGSNGLHLCEEYHLDQYQTSFKDNEFWLKPRTTDVPREIRHCGRTRWSAPTRRICRHRPIRPLSDGNTNIENAHTNGHRQICRDVTKSVTAGGRGGPPLRGGFGHFVTSNDDKGHQNSKASRLQCGRTRRSAHTRRICQHRPIRRLSDGKANIENVPTNSRR